MNKKEAASYLGITARALEYHATHGKVGVTYEKGRTGDVAIFDDADIERLKREIDKRHRPRKGRGKDATPCVEIRIILQLDGNGVLKVKKA